VNPAAGGKLFFMEPSTGNLIVASRLSVDTSTVYNITVVARDVNNDQTTCSVAVIVMRGNNSFRFINEPYKFQINYTTSAGYLLGFIRTAGGVGGITYATDFERSFETYFSVNSSTGAVRLSRSVASDVQLTYFMFLRVTDQSGAQLNTAVEVAVNRNLYAPSFLGGSYIARIYEDARVGDTIASLQVVDSDPNTVVSCYLDGPITRATVEFFQVTNACEVYLNAPIIGQAELRYDI